MGFSATEWATRLSEWSGSSQGNKSWSGLGASTRQGEYYSYVAKPSYYSGQMNWGYLGFAPTAINPRNVEAFYAYAYRYDYYYRVYYSNLCGYTYTAANYSTANPFNYYQPQGYYDGIAQYMPSPSTNYSAISYTFSFYEVTQYGGSGGVTSWSPATFYNYAPWGAPPYTAGANISIGPGNGPAFSGYPYQYIHT
jgi:hypothetical protein